MRKFTPPPPKKKKKKKNWVCKILDLKKDKYDGYFNVMYFAFYTYQKTTRCWKRRGPKVCDISFQVWRPYILL